MSPEMLALLLKSFWETCYMVLASTILATHRRTARRDLNRHP